MTPLQQRIFRTGERLAAGFGVLVLVALAPPDKRLEMIIILAGIALAAYALHLVWGKE